MILLIALLLAGIIAGYFLRRFSLSWLPTWLTIIICALLFAFGLEAGSNERVVQGFSSLGLQSMVIAFTGLAGSCILAMVLEKVAFRHHSQKQSRHEK